MKEELVIGCDIGTGSCKAVAWSASGKAVAGAQVFYDVCHPREGYSEQDPQVILNAFKECVKTLMAKLKSPPAALSLSSCMHSLLLLDKKHQPLTPLITWEDTRSSTIARKLRESSLGRKIYKNTGTPVHSMAPVCKIAWFQKNNKRNFQRAAKFIGIKEYLWLMLFGVLEIDHSVASATGLFDIQKATWYPPALKFCGITPDRLSLPVKTSFFRKHPSREFIQTTGLPAGIAMCIGASDGCLANVGSHIHGKGNAAITIGTSAAVRVNTSAPVIDTHSMIFNYMLDHKTYISGGPLNNGGNVIRWVMKEFLGIKGPSEKDFQFFSEKTAAIPAGCNGLICLPYFFSERAPVWDEKAAAIWFGVRAHHSRFHLIRAVQEGITYSLKMILDDLEKRSNPVHTIYVSGGFIHSSAWVQMIADITQKKVVINETGDASSIGAAIWAMKALKIKPAPRTAHEKKVLLPRKQFVDIYKKQFGIFKQIYPLTKKQIHQLQS